MASYEVRIMVDGTNIASVRKQMAAAFPGEEVRCDKIEFNKSRAERLSEAESLVEEAKSIVEELNDEMEAWHESIPENLQSSDKASEVEAAKDALENLQSELENVNFGDVDFPAMF